MDNITIDNFLLNDTTLNKNLNNCLWCAIFMIQFAYIKNVDDYDSLFEHGMVFTSVKDIEEFESWFEVNKDYIISKLNKTFDSNITDITPKDFIALLVKYAREDRLLL